MSGKINVMPAPGRKVRGEDGRHIPADRFTPVPESTYWLRRLAAGDVVREGAPAPAAAPAARPPIIGRGRGPADDPERAAVAIPDNWRGLPWPQLRALAASLSPDPVNNAEQARAIIQDERARRVV